MNNRMWNCCVSFPAGWNLEVFVSMDMNMDVKDLIAMLKNKTGKGKGTKKDSRGGSSFVNFFEKNPKMKIILPAFLILIAVAVAVVLIVTGIQTETDVDPDSAVAGAAVEVLPMQERTEGETLADGVDPFAEDVIANAKLRGLIYNSDGYWTAIVDTQYASYTLQVGDYVGSSSWLVEEITSNTVTFSLGEKTRTIEMKT